MKIELKNVKHSEFASQETDCFEATLYIDGKRSGRVWNDGQGGSHGYEDWDACKRIDAYAKTLPESDISEFFSDGEKHTIPQSAETIISELVQKWLQKKQCANKVMYRIPSYTYKQDEWHSIKGKFTPEVRARLVAKYGQETVFFNDQFVD